MGQPVRSSLLSDGVQADRKAAVLLLVSHDYDTPAIGDIVVVGLRDHERAISDVVKRVVALPGDEVAFQGDIVHVNGTLVDAHPVIVHGPAGVSGALVVPDGTIFILGDNRPASLDSRFYGPIAMASVRGKAVAIYAPITRIGRVDGPSERD